MTDRQVNPANVIETLREMLSAAQLDAALTRAALREEMAAREQAEQELKELREEVRER